MEKFNAICAKTYAAISSKKAASLWEYLLVIAIVCIIGAVLINVISGSGGIASLWDSLLNKFKTLINVGVNAS